MRITALRAIRLVVRLGNTAEAFSAPVPQGPGWGLALSEAATARFAV